MSSEGEGLVERLRARRNVNMAWGDDALAAVDAEINLGLEAADRISALEAEVERLTREVEVWREGWEDDGRDVRYFSKAMSAQQRSEDLCAKLKLAQTTINFVRRWAVEKEGNGTSAEERLSVIANHPGIALHSIRED